MIIASCPTRISLGSADHSPFAELYGGIALNMCIDKRIYVILRPRTRLEEHKYRVCYSRTELCNCVDDIELDIVREAMKLVGVDQPLEIIYAADVPAKLGLATSSAFILALLKGLYSLKNTAVAPEILADQAYRLERNQIGQIGGFQDHYIGWGGINFLYGKPHSVERKSVVLSPTQVETLERHFLLVYTGDQMCSHKILTEQIASLKRGDTITQTLEVKKIVEKMHEVMSQPYFHPMDLACLVNEQWELKKQMASTIVSDNILQLEESIRKACPPAGVRLIGSGGRGFMLVIAPEEMRDKLIAAVHPYRCSQFSLDWDGCKIHRGL